jgi:serine/threonine-protein kinase HipA
MVEILELLKGSDKPAEDQSAFLQAQILFWLLGATDGNAKNFSVFLGPRGRYRLTPIYDVLSAQPSAERRDVERKHLKLAMFAGDSRHYRLDEICGRHFVQTVKRARLPETLARDALQKIGDTAKEALDGVHDFLEGVPGGFPGAIHKAVSKGFKQRLARIAA